MYEKSHFFSHCHTTIPGSIWSWEGGSTIFNLKADHWRNTHIFPYETCHNLGLDQPESVVICDLYRKLAPLGCFHPGLSKFAKKVLPFGLPWPAVPAPPKSVPCHFHMLRVCHKTGHEANMKLYWWFRGKNTRKQYPWRLDVKCVLKRARSRDWIQEGTTCCGWVYSSPDPYMTDVC